MRKKSVLIVVLMASLVLLTGLAAAQGLEDPRSGGNDTTVDNDTDGDPLDDRFGGDDTTEDDDTDPGSATNQRSRSVSVRAEAQATEGDSVTIDSVEIDQDGWVGVYEEDIGGEPDLSALVGSAEVDEGTNTNIEVDTDLEESGFYYAVPHYEEPSQAGLNDPVEVNGTDIQDFFYAAVGTRDVHQSYAEAKQNRRALSNRLSDLRERVDDLERRNERSDDESIQSDINRLNSEIDSVEQDIQNLDSTISETESLLRQLEEAEQEAEEAESDNETGIGGNETGVGGNETGVGGADNETEDGSEGLPGFTAVAALVAALSAALLARRNR